MAFEWSILAAFGTMFCWAFGDFFTQRTTWKVGDMETITLIGLLGSLFLLPFILPELHLLLSWQNASFMLVLGLISFYTSWSNFEAYRVGKLSIIEITLQVALPVTLLLSFFVIRERVSAQQFLVMMVIFFGVMLTSIRSFSHLKSVFSKFEKGALLGLLAAVGWGFINFLTGFSSKEISPLLGLWVPWTIFGLAALAMLIKNERHFGLWKNIIKYKKPILLMAVFNTLAWIFYVIATYYNKISISTAITESYPALSLLLDVKFNKRIVGWHQYLGAAIAIIASVALGFFIH